MMKPSGRVRHGHNFERCGSIRDFIQFVGVASGEEPGAANVMSLRLAKNTTRLGAPPSGTRTPKHPYDPKRTFALKDWN